jgi:hypothetical protein
VKGAEVADPGAFAWRRGPLSAGLPEIGGLKVRSALALEPARGTKTLLDSDRGAMAVNGEAPGGVRFVAVGFRLEDSNLPLLAAFPVLLRNTFDWLTGEERRYFPAALGLGEPLANRRPLPASAGAEAVVTRVREAADAALPAGGPLRIPLRDGRALAPAAADPGYYRIEAGTLRELAAVNFANASESNLRPAELAGATTVPAVAETGRRKRAEALSTILIAAALALLVAEWWLFQRGIL